MGQWNNSVLHKIYPWFLQNLGERYSKCKELLQCDSGRSWIEYKYINDQISLLARISIVNGSMISYSPIQASLSYQHEQWGIKDFRLYTNGYLQEFIVKRFNEKEMYIFENQDMCKDFLLSLRQPEENFLKKNCKSYGCEDGVLMSKIDLLFWEQQQFLKELTQEKMERGHDDLNNVYSDWHLRLREQKKYKSLYIFDLDKAMCIYNDINDGDSNPFKFIIFDLKREIDLGNGMTKGELDGYECYKGKGVKIFIVYISENWRRFTIAPFDRWGTNTGYLFTDDLRYGEFALSLGKKEDFFESYKPMPFSEIMEMGKIDDTINKDQDQNYGKLFRQVRVL